MSGSSLDGVDLAFCEFWKDDKGWDSRLLHAETIPYPAQLKSLLEGNNGWNPFTVREADEILGTYLAGLINDFHARHKIIPDLISSHGHTLFHRPEKGMTFQAGNGAVIANRTGIMVINDFRTEDVEQGGQGAPLVPIGDLLLFGTYDACINIGGFANISFNDSRKRRIAFDIGPANLALNYAAALAGLDYDRDGELAAQGTVNQGLLIELNSLEFYGMLPPKSLGKEWFREVFLAHAGKTGLPVPELMATLVEHIAIQLASALALACANRVLVTGGGALNKSLMDRFRFYSGADIHIPCLELIEFKEALIFAFLGLLRLMGEVNCLSSVTGGVADLSCGVLHQPTKNKR